MQVANNAMKLYKDIKNGSEEFGPRYSAAMISTANQQ